jgi:5-methylcytosine-specific restriction endonuclease McrA
VKHQKSMKRKRETESNEQVVTSCETHRLQNHYTSLITSHENENENENENEQKDEVVCVFCFKCSKKFSQLNSITGF